MRRILFVLALLLILLPGCTFSFEVLTPTPVVADIQLMPYSTQTDVGPLPSETPTAVPIPPTLAVPTTAPIFFNGRVAATQEEPFIRQTSFPAGTKIVYVVWDYQNMQQGMQVRREWWLNGQPWLTREETWNFQKYGSTGTMRDISIHDEVAGLDSGTYHLRIYIDNVLQPLGSNFYEPISEWVSFDIGTPQEESFMGYGSPDGQWGVEVYGGNRVVLKNVTSGATREIVIVQEVPYVTWFADSRHFLFVDRDRSEQKSTTTIGIRDHLWIVDVATGQALRVYKGDTSFLGQWGPLPSPDGNYIAALEGSSFGDACFIDKRLIFFEVAPNFQSVVVIKQQEITGIPSYQDSSVYPREDGVWENANVYRIQLDGTCFADQSKLGMFLVNVPNRTAVPQTQVGDLGVGMVHGKVTDAAGAPIANAVVTCEHHSYAPSSLCSGSVSTNAQGEYAFSPVSFHDTDTITVTVQAAGYQSRKVSQSFFAQNDWAANIALSSMP